MGSTVTIQNNHLFCHIVLTVTTIVRAQQLILIHSHNLKPSRVDAFKYPNLASQNRRSDLHTQPSKSESFDCTFLIQKQTIPLKPSTRDWGLSGIKVRSMDYRSAFCNLSQAQAQTTEAYTNRKAALSKVKP